MRTAIVAVVILIFGLIGWQSMSRTDDTVSETKNEVSTEGEADQAASVMEREVSQDQETMDEETENMESMESEVEADAKVFSLTGKNFEFSQTEIRVKKGDTVTVNFKSTDGFHDWVVDEFKVNTDRVRPENGQTSVTFVADKAGKFEFYCSVGEHRAQGMVGMLVVE